MFIVADLVSLKKRGTIKVKNILLPIGRTFFPLKVAPMRIDNNFKGKKLRNRQNLTMSICQSFKITKFDAANFK